MAKIKINVTQDDIEQGKRNCGNHCAIARAVKREIEELVPYDVTPEIGGLFGDFYVSHVGSFDVKLTRKAAKFIRDFDNGRPVKPFSFTLTILN